LDAISKYSSPDQLRAAQAQGGALDQLRASFGNQVDANTIRGAADARVAALQQQAQQEVAYNHMMADERVAPLVDQYKQAVLKGDSKAAAALEGQYQKLGGRDLAGLASYADARANEMKLRGYADQTQSLNQDRGRQEILASKAAIENAAAQTRIAQGTLANQERQTSSNIQYNQFNMDRQTKQDNAALLAGQAEAVKKSLKEAGNIYADGTYNGSQAEDVLQTLVKNQVGSNNEQRTKLIGKLNQMAKDGVEITTPDGKKTIKVQDLPMSAIIAAANGSHNPFWVAGWNSGVASNFEENLKGIIGTMYDNNGQLSSKTLEDQAAFKQALANARQNAVGILPNRTPRPNK
jgi:hypothetical protein